MNNGESLLKPKSDFIYLKALLHSRTLFNYKEKVILDCTIDKNPVKWELLLKFILIIIAFTVVKWDKFNSSNIAEF